MQIAHVYVGFLRILEEMGVETRTDQYRNAKSSRFLRDLYTNFLLKTDGRWNITANKKNEKVINYLLRFVYIYNCSKCYL